jgi:uncharacterized Zn finger protein (UPF0148 family)
MTDTECRNCGKPLAVQSGPGRTPQFCNSACKQMNYRQRRDVRLKQERREREITAARHAAEREQHRAARYLAKLENIIMGELAKLPDNSRVSTTQRKELAARLAIRLGTEQLTI